MNLDTRKILKTLNPNKVWLPAAISIGFVIFKVISDDQFTPERLRLIFDARIWPVVMAFIVLLIKEAAYIYRIRTLTNEELSWTSSIYVIILWEFASAVTPSVVGGTAVAVFILVKEGISLGKSLAYVMLTAILDNLFFVLAAPLALLFLGEDIFPESTTGSHYIFITSYSLIAIYTIIMSLALFWKPRLFKWVLIKLTSIKWLRRWRYAAYQHGNEVMWASSLIKGKPAGYWIRISVATIVAWVARYSILNFLVAAYTKGLSLYDHLIIFGKHLILWIVMLISPTPGSTGTAEHFFMKFFNEYLFEFTLGAALLWRIITFYPYLIVGALALPRWIARVFFKKKKEDALQS
ncbi:lysylphosphatidylglycerol synthase transmembrane domain-containing protein [Fulvivirga sedimenti]|uniref:Flippase-like domain-containing protein n=1 Tax=Fulvivirga sedimenti TaxID=2879465 RepID=A0A9X1KZU2_9BACT|nr:lysylphosphatidylglycerol synthase transmembrane domain-containing protein [Fulvivirga sedimenti]MCA6078665.1 flippase-like domain-containing protein [Fulvivirga sedimenti]